MSLSESARLTRIRIYPIKSLDGVDIDRVAFNGLGGLSGDREYQIIDELGRVLNAKRAGEVITRIRARYGSNGRVMSLQRGDSEGRFWLPDDLS
ncbi:MAG: MOSC N-terminal beta barrel domain-containing protein [Acidobacteria bacterium]|nr:MOSC N-terminal beta barrel domain-containing protein [Acidobacteriota bacterium]MDA1236295.1 MOSC N-terminal beta barrel domain-containing protein [Acidobacteriota bacterium]